MKLHNLHLALYDLLDFVVQTQTAKVPLDNRTYIPHGRQTSYHQ
jgi:hypothetical protein